MSVTTVVARVVAVAVSLAAVGSAALAGEDAAPACSCLAPLSGDGSSVFTAVSGDVSTLGPSGFSPARVGGRVLPGARVVVGAKGGAALRVGSKCDLKLGPNSDAEISVVDKKFCVRVAVQDPRFDSFVAQRADDEDDKDKRRAGVILPEGAAGGLGAGGAALGGVPLGAVALGAVGLAVGIGGLAASAQSVSK